MDAIRTPPDADFDINHFDSLMYMGFLGALAGQPIRNDPDSPIWQVASALKSHADCALKPNLALAEKILQSRTDILATISASDVPILVRAMDLLLKRVDTLPINDDLQMRFRASIHGVKAMLNSAQLVTTVRDSANVVAGGGMVEVACFTR